MKTPTVFFCCGCNEKFEVTAGRGERRSLASLPCPACGVELGELGTVVPGDLEAARARQAVGGSAEADPLVGTRLGDYQLQELVGTGGMGRVYRAVHLGLERTCAVKVLDPELASRDPGYVEMFLSEARAAAALVHPNIVTVHNVGNDQGLSFIEMEYIEGRSLSKAVHESGVLLPYRAASLIAQACAGLAEAHRRGVVHRDLKPGNILVSPAGVAKLADFGLAKRVLGRKAVPVGLTDEDPAPIANRLVGTPHFMAPELFEGRTASQGSDIYAVGISFYFLLTGRLPFAAPTVREMIRKHRETPVPLARRLRPEVPVEADEILSACLAKRVDRRLDDAAELQTRLHSLMASLRDLEELVRRSLLGLSFEWSGVGRDEVEVRLRLEDGRGQTVSLRKCRGVSSEMLLRISSPCAPVDSSYYRRALELNGQVPHGAIGIESHDGRPYFVMTSSYPWATCDSEEVRASVLSIAEWADAIEQTLTGHDHH